MKASDELRAAKAVLIERGWYQGDYVNDVTGEVCVMGAVNVVEDGDPRCSDEDEDYEPEPGTAKFYLDRLVFLAWSHDIGEWNDARGRTPEQVLELFDRAIALAERDESASSVGAVARTDGLVAGVPRAHEDFVLSPSLTP